MDKPYGFVPPPPLPPRGVYQSLRYVVRTNLKELAKRQKSERHRNTDFLTRS